MSKIIRSPRHEALRDLLKTRRQQARLTQDDVGTKMGRHQGYVSAVEQGQRRVTVVEYLEFAEAIGFDPNEALREIAAAKPGREKKRGKVTFDEIEKMLIDILSKIRDRS